MQRVLREGLGEGWRLKRLAWICGFETTDPHHGLVKLALFDLFDDTFNGTRSLHDTHFIVL